MVGRAPCMHSVYRMARLVAARNTPVLITGATGTGKEVVANAIHRLSPRAGKEFVVINCAAIPEALLESELFGYIRKPFTPDQMKQHVLPLLEKTVSPVSTVNGATQ